MRTGVTLCSGSVAGVYPGDAQEPHAVTWSRSSDVCDP